MMHPAAVTMAALMRMQLGMVQYIVYMHQPDVQV